MHDDCVVYIKKVTRVKEILDGKWKLQILCAMRSGPVRLSQLTRLAPAASKKGLRANLRSLESSHIVVRRDLSDSVLHVGAALLDFLIFVKFRASSPVRGRLRLRFFLDEFQRAATTGWG
jgi:DNA-binding HxlR family transcriptional regulator